MFMDMSSDELKAFASAVSSILGWLYFLAWSISFWPQPITNWRRGSPDGLAFDFPLANSIGMASYTIANGCFLFSPTIRSQFSYRHDGVLPTVRLNDFVFALHGFILVMVCFSQYYPWIWGLRVPPEQRSSGIMRIICTAAVLAVLVSIGVVLARGHDGGMDPAGWAWIDVVVMLGNIKLVLTFVKYTPQIIHNYVRQSTTGFNIIGIVLDTAGGIMSLLQLVIDSSLQGTWRYVTNNPAKLMLAFLSLAFDSIFLTQHYVLYGDVPPRKVPAQERLIDDEESAGERQPLLR